MHSDRDLYARAPSVHGRSVMIFDSRSGNLLKPFGSRHLLPDDAPVDCRAIGAELNLSTRKTPAMIKG
jgi:hypothetical protein